MPAFTPQPLWSVCIWHEKIHSWFVVGAVTRVDAGDTDDGLPYVMLAEMLDDLQIADDAIMLLVPQWWNNLA